MGENTIERAIFEEYLIGKIDKAWAESEGKRAGARELINREISQHSQSEKGWVVFDVDAWDFPRNFEFLVCESTGAVQTELYFHPSSEAGLLKFLSIALGGMP